MPAARMLWCASGFGSRRSPGFASKKEGFFRLPVIAFPGRSPVADHLVCHIEIERGRIFPRLQLRGSAGLAPASQ